MTERACTFVVIYDCVFRKERLMGGRLSHGYGFVHVSLFVSQEFFLTDYHFNLRFVGFM